MIRNDSFSSTLIRTVLTFLVTTIVATGMAKTTVMAQSPATDPADWQFVTAGDKLYLVSGSQEFVTEVDTSQLPVKYFVHPQIDRAGNIYLLSVSSSDSSKQLANHSRQQSVYYTRTEGSATNWRELKGGDLGLSSDSGIYDFGVYTDGPIVVLGKNSEIFSGTENPSTKSYEFKPFQAAIASKVSLSQGDLVPTDGGMAHLLPSGKLAPKENLARVLGGVRATLSLGNVTLYIYPDPRDPDQPDRNLIKAYNGSGAESYQSMSVPRPVLDMSPIGVHDYYAIWTDTNVWLMQRPKTGKAAFGPVTDVTAALGVEGKIISVAAYQTGFVTNNAGRDADKNITFYIGTDKGQVVRSVIKNPTDISTKTLKLLAPTYKIGKVASAVGPSGVFAPTPIEPKEVVPGQPGVIQPAGQTSTTQSNAESTQASNTASESSESGTPDIFLIGLAVSAVLVFALLILIGIAKAHKNKQKTTKQPGPIRTHSRVNRSRNG